MARRQTATARRWRVPRTRIVFGVVSGLALVLGIWGLSLLRFEPGYATRFGTTWADVVYYGLQLFVLGADPASGGGSLPWQLQAARFLAPAGAAYALVDGARLLFADELRRLRTRGLHDHAIVVGDSGAADVIAEALDAQGRQVVRIDGDSEQALADAGVAGAAVVYACLDDSEDPLVNVAVAAEAAHLAADGRHRLSVNAHVSDPRLALAIQARHLSRRAPGVDFFTLDEMAARALARLDWAAVGGSRPYLAILGGGVFGRSLAVALVRARELNPGDGTALTVTFYGPDGAEAAKDVQERLAHRRTGSTVLAAEAFPLPGDPAYPVRTYVCHDDDGEALRTALTFAPAWHGGPGSLVLRLNRLEQVQQTFADPGGASLLDDLAGRLRVVRASDLLHPHHGGGPLAHEDVYERMAESVHHRYLRNQLSRGVGWGERPAMVRWDDLGDTFRAANRDQVRAIPEKLATVGCTIAPASPHLPTVVLSDDETEALAQDEHRRWMADRAARGYVYGPVRDDDGTPPTHPSMVPWDELTPDDQQKDRDAVRGMAEALADLGLQIVRY